MGAFSFENLLPELIVSTLILLLGVGLGVSILEPFWHIW